jgi:PEGA domain
MRHAIKLLGLCSGLLMWSSSLPAQLRPEAPADRKAPAKDARIVVETLPSAEVYLDDVFQGRASSAGRVVIAGPKIGDHTLRVTLAGKKDYEDRLTVASGKDTSVRVVLDDMPARILVHSAPGADVFLDDTRRGTTDANGELAVSDLPAGPHTVRLSAHGKTEFQQQVSVGAGKEASVQAPLTDLPGKILVHSAPGADVFLDETRRGTADAGGELIVSDVPAGSHALRVSARGKKDFQQQLSVPAGTEASVQAPLTDLAGRIVVHSSPGADVLVDDVRRGTTDSGGDLIVPDVPPGSHDLRVWASGKKNFQQLVSVNAAQETRIDASLASLEPPPAPPPVHTSRVMVKMGMLSYITGVLTVDSASMSFHSNDGKTSFAFPFSDVDHAFETLGDLGSRHDLHVLLKSGRKYEMINAEAAGHGQQGAQFVSQTIGLINGTSAGSKAK